MENDLKFNVDSLSEIQRKVVHSLKCEVNDDSLYFGKPKGKFCLLFKTNKSKHRSYGKGKQIIPQKQCHSYYAQDYHRDIDN